MTHTTEELERLLAEATPGRWFHTAEGDIRSEQVVTDDGKTYTDSFPIATGECYQPWGYIDWANLNDAALIVAAVNALPELLEKVKRLEEAHGHEKALPLRDWFAGQWITGAASVNGTLDVSAGASESEIDAAYQKYWREAARTAYIAADALLTARQGETK